VRHALLLAATAALLGLTARPAQAGEGMWTFNDFPSAKVQERHGFAPSPQWLDRVRLASAKFGGGCSSSFVSPTGLVMTNHHCARSCIEQLSSAKANYLEQGFNARTQGEEKQCPALEVNQLLGITDVTGPLNKATEGLTGKAYADTLKAEMNRLEKECGGADAKVRCDVVTLYQGGRYNLYRYKRYDDVRLVFAPEHDIAFFGGDPDNFEFPRYDLDLTFVRVYEGGKPAATPNHFTWSRGGPKEGELTFISGHPGRTSRGLTVAQLEYARDVTLPASLATYSEQRGVLTEFQKRGAEQRRVSSSLLFGIENSLKVMKGRQATLVDRAFFAKKVQEEQALRQKVKADPKLEGKYGAAWDAVAKAMERARELRREHSMLEGGNGFQGTLFGYARTVVRAAEELPKDNGQRLRGYGDAALPGLKARLFSAAPVSAELERLRLAHGLTKMREELGADHPVVKKVLGKESPDTLAARVVKGTRLFDVKARQALFEGGKAAVAASQDPMVRLAALVDPDARAVDRTYEDEVEAVVRKNSELIAKARFDVYGTGTYPDATGTLRLSFGEVKGYQEDGKPVAPFTQMGGAFERHTGEEPFRLPKSWMKAQGKLAPATPYNFVSTNDIIGGNSGSPVINKNAEVVGLVFDGNIQSLGGEYGYDESQNRAVSVHSEAILEALDKVYGATRVLEELRPASAAVPATPAR
jgi:hypothetical protein